MACTEFVKCTVNFQCSNNAVIMMHRWYIYTQLCGRWRVKIWCSFPWTKPSWNISLWSRLSTSRTSVLNAYKYGLMVWSSGKSSAWQKHLQFTRRMMSGLFITSGETGWFLKFRKFTLAYSYKDTALRIRGAVLIMYSKKESTAFCCH